MALTVDDILAVLEHLCTRMGIQWSEKFGSFLLGRVLERFDRDGDGTIRGQEFEDFLMSFAKRPLLQARHRKHVVVLGGGAFGTGVCS